MTPEGLSCGLLLCSAVLVKVREDGGHTEPGRDRLPGTYRLSAARGGNTEDLLWGSDLLGDCKCLFGVVWVVHRAVSLTSNPLFSVSNYTDHCTVRLKIRCV